MPNEQWKTPDDGQRNCPKHVEFRTRINLEISSSVGLTVNDILITGENKESEIRASLTYFLTGPRLETLVKGNRSIQLDLAVSNVNLENTPMKENFSLI